MKRNSLIDHNLERETLTKMNKKYLKQFCSLIYMQMHEK